MQRLRATKEQALSQAQRYYRVPITLKFCGSLFHKWVKIIFAMWHAPCVCTNLRNYFIEISKNHYLWKCIRFKNNVGIILCVCISATFAPIGTTPCIVQPRVHDVVLKGKHHSVRWVIFFSSCRKAGTCGDLVSVISKINLLWNFWNDSQQSIGNW